MKEMCQEMIKLRAKLNILGIQWFDCSDPIKYRKISCDSYKESNLLIKRKCDEHDFGIDRTKFYIDDIEFSVINGFCTYGGYRPFFDDDNKGLLELMIGSNNPYGDLTADDIIEIINAWQNKEKGETK